MPPAGPVKVTDFGIAKAGEGRRPHPHRHGDGHRPVPGAGAGQRRARPTPAPTSTRSGSSSTRCCAAGRPSAVTATSPPRWPGSRRRRRRSARSVPTCRAALDDVVHRCLARDPARRFPSASAVRTALAAVRTNPRGAAPRAGRRARPRPRGRVPAPSPPKARRPAPRRSGGMTWFWVGVVFLLAIAAAVVAFVIIRDDQSNSPNPDTSTRRPPGTSTATVPAARTAGRPRADAPMAGRSLRDDDADLAARASRGDRRALETLLDRHADRVHALCRRVIAHREDALDATQEAMIAIARGIDRFDGRSAFTTWLYRVATNAALDELRRKQRRPEPVDTTVYDRPTPRRQRLDDTASAIGSTSTPRSPRCRPTSGSRWCCVTCATSTTPQIAEVLEIPPGTVRSRIARGRALLAAALGNPDAPSERLKQRWLTTTRATNAWPACSRSSRSTRSRAAGWSSTAMRAAAPPAATRPACVRWPVRRRRLVVVDPGGGDRLPRVRGDDGTAPSASSRRPQATTTPVAGAPTEAAPTTQATSADADSSDGSESSEAERRRPAGRRGSATSAISTSPPTSTASARRSPVSAGRHRRRRPTGERHRATRRPVAGAELRGAAPRGHGRRDRHRALRHPRRDRGGDRAWPTAPTSLDAVVRSPCEVRPLD